jgi:hypothetical protein
MKEHSELESLLHRLATESPRHAHAAMERRVLAAFRSYRRRGPRRLFFAAVAAACLAIAVWSFRDHPFARRGLTSPANLTSGFLPLPYAQSDVPLEQAVIVRVELEPSAWGALNMPGSAPKPGSTVSADLLVGQDGIARAVRLVSIQ